MQLTLGAIIAGGLGYVFQVLMGRLLVDEEFAVFSSLNALSMVFGSPLAALVMLIARRVASLQAAGEEGALPAIYRFWQTRIVAAGVVLAGLVAWGMPAVVGFVKTTDTVSVWLFIGVVSLNALVVVNLAFLQGLHRFGWLSGLAILIVILKIVSSVSLIVVANWGVRGSLAGMLCAAGTVWAVGVAILQRDFARAEPVPSKEIAKHGFSWREAGPVLSATVGFAVLSQMDVPLANRFFEPGVASAYAAAAVLGKAVLYIPGGLVMALFPMVAANETRSESSGRLLKQSLLVTLVLCGVVVVGYAILGKQVIGVLYGGRYPGAGALLGLYSLAMIPLVIVLVMKNFFIASGRNAFAWAIGASASGFVCGMLLSRPSVPGGVIAAVASFALTACSVGVWLLMYSNFCRRKVET